MGPREIPGFYFDPDRKRYFAISTNQPDSQALSSVQKYSDESLKRRKLANEDLEAFVPVSNVASAACFERECKFKDIRNERFRTSFIVDRCRFNELNNWSSQVGWTSEINTKQLSYDSGLGLLMLTTYNKVYHAWFDIHSTTRPQLSEYAFQIDPNPLPITHSRFLRHFAMVNVRKTSRTGAADGHIITLSKVSKYVNEMGDYKNLEVHDFNENGDVQLADDCIALTCKNGVELFDFRRFYKKFQIRSSKKSQFITLDFHSEKRGLDFQKSDSNMMAIGTNNGCIYLVDSRQTPKLSQPTVKLSEAVPILNVKFSADNRNNFLTNATNGAMLMYDIRNTSAPVVEFSKVNSILKKNRGNQLEWIAGDYFAVKDDLLNQIKLYDCKERTPVKLLNGAGLGKLDQFVKITNPTGNANGLLMLDDRGCFDFLKAAV